MKFKDSRRHSDFWRSRPVLYFSKQIGRLHVWLWHRSWAKF